MKIFVALLSLLVMVAGGFTGCGGCGGDDDDDASDDDDDTSDDDDDASGDDDAPDDDDDAGDDDASDDDDDATDDDADDDDTGSDEFWTDPETGYDWYLPTSKAYMYWSDAVAYCTALVLDGGSWHLPTISEYRTLIRNCPGTETGGTCTVTDGCASDAGCRNADCFGCEAFPTDCNFDPPDFSICDVMYSSTETTDLENTVWILDFRYATVDTMYKTVGAGVACVRP
ncbi:MAG: DUF1566 domain-containing protein [Deltaproteobacteria bacterium]|nr:DUF1566 domain-containing protein [Deltaproteobacteria bacterium]